MKCRKLLSRIVSIICMLVIMISFAGCGKDSNSKVVFTTGLSKNEVFRIGKEVCTVDEIMVYLVNTQNQYQAVYGEEIWNYSLNGVTLEDNIKETVLAKIAQIKSMYLLAKQMEIELDDTEKNKVSMAAEEYFGSLSEAEIKIMGVTQNTIEKLYEEYALADKVYDYIIRDVNPEISDDEARTIIVQHILIRTRKVDDAGNVVEFSEDKKEECLKRANDIYNMAMSDEYEFEELAAKYSEDENISYSFGKGEMDEAFETAAFKLQTGEISPVIKSDIGYHIIKCLSTFDKEETDENKLKIVEKRRQEVFSTQYDAFVEEQIRELNEKTWKEISLVYDEQVDTSSFFEVYRSYLKD